MPPVTLTILSRKGGVGRTTNAINLAGAFAEKDVSVLLLDLDGQASLSRVFLGSTEVESLRPQETVAAIFQGETPEVIRSTDYPGISLVPSNDSLEPLVTAVKRDFHRDQYLIREFLESLGTEYDLCIIDTPPHTNVSSVFSALVASHYVLSIVPADAFGVQSISSVINLVASVQSGPNPSLLVLGYVLSMLQRNSVNGAYRKTLRGLHGGQVFDIEIPLAAAFKEAVAARGPVTHLKGRTKAAKIIRELATEIEKRLEVISERNAAA